MTPFAPRDICKTPHSMYVRMPQAMAQFVPNLKKSVSYQRDSPNTINSLRYDRKYIVVMTQLV